MQSRGPSREVATDDGHTISVLYYREQKDIYKYRIAAGSRIHKKKTPTINDRILIPSYQTLFGNKLQK